MRFMTAALLVLAGSQDDEKGFEKIFNGKDLTGWKFQLEKKEADPAKTFSVTDETIVCTGAPKGYMHTEKSYKEFTLRFDYRYKRPEKLEDDEKFDGNSGYLLFIQEHKVWPKCIEVQGMNKTVATISPLGGAKAKFTEDGEARKKARKAVGEWNAIEIVVKGGTITSSLNGAKVSTVAQIHGSRDCSRSRSGLPIRRRAAARASSPLMPSASARACAFISS